MIVSRTCKSILIVLLGAVAVAGCSQVALRAPNRGDLLRSAVEGTLALPRVKVVDRTAFPSSPRLLSAKEARALGTGVWTRVVEYEAPDRIHYVSSSEDGGIEAYRVGVTMVYRPVGAGAPDGANGRWLRVTDPHGVDNEYVRSELGWLAGVTGIRGIVDGALLDAKNVRKVGDERIGVARFTVLSVEVPEWFERFCRGLEEGATPAKPISYEVRVWVTSPGEPLLSRIEDTYIYQDPESGAYEYVTGDRVFENPSGAEIQLPSQNGGYQEKDGGSSEH